MLFTFILGCFILVGVHNYEQNDYKLVLDHWQLHEYNKMFLNYAYLRNVKPNRTYKGLDCGFSTKRDFTGDKFKVHVQAFQLYHNEYRATPVVFEVKLCDVFEQKLFGIEMIMTINGNITTCPLKKNVYYIHNFMFDESGWPPYLPRGSFQVKGSYKYGDAVIASLSWFGEIKDIVKY